MPQIKIGLKPKGFYLGSQAVLKLDRQWDRKTLGEKAGMKGVYIIFTNPGHVIYVGKTSGNTMSFRARLFRHATKAASSNSRVYRELKKITRKGDGPIRVAMIDEESIGKHFPATGVRLSEEVTTGLLELALIQYLEPERQQKQWQLS